MRRVVVFGLIVLFAFGSAYAGSGAHWGYSGHEGPAHWGELDEAYEMCGLGKNQSPINLTGFIKANLKPLKMNYKTDSTDILNNGHAVQVNYAAGSTLTVGDAKFELKQFHFHALAKTPLKESRFPWKPTSFMLTRTETSQLLR